MINKKVLKQRLAKFNRQFFSMDLENVYILFSKEETVGAAAETQIYLDAKTGKHVYHILVNPILKYLNNELDNTIIHELIHVWQHKKGLPLDHEKEFQDWCVKCNEDGYNVSSVLSIGFEKLSKPIYIYSADIKIDCDWLKIAFIDESKSNYKINNFRVALYRFIKELKDRVGGEEYQVLMFDKKSISVNEISTSDAVKYAWLPNCGKFVYGDVRLHKI